MPFLLLIVGLILVVTAIRDTTGSFVSHLQQDLTAQQGGVSFAVWVLAIVAIGGIGYVPQLRGISRGLLVLIALVLLLKNQGGVLSQFVQQVSNPPAATKPTGAVPNDLPAIPVQIQQQGSGGAAGGLGTAIGAADAGLKLFSLFGG